jgi:hypothetical protein
MEKQEAIRVLKSPLSGNINHNHWDGWCMTEEFAEAIDEAIKALSGPVPDPETGLVPCGCGGKAEIAGSSGDADYYSIICVECDIDTDSYEKKEDAKAAWNRAMGYKEDA